MKNFTFKKIVFLSVVGMLAIAPAQAVFAATAKVAPKPVVKKYVWKPAVPEGYTKLSWVHVPGVESYFRAPQESGSLDYLTRIYIPKNQIQFVRTVTDLIDKDAIITDVVSPGSAVAVPADVVVPTLQPSSHHWSFMRFVAETQKASYPGLTFLWSAPFFNMGFSDSDLSMGFRATEAGKTYITMGTRSALDIAQPRQMLVVNNDKGRAAIKPFDEAAFMDVSQGDQAIEGFSPLVSKTDGRTAVASRVYAGVSEDGRELVVYCSRQASNEEASTELTRAGVPVERQIQFDGGGSASCGYGLPGQFFVEPSRTLPVMMGAVGVVFRGTVLGTKANVRKNGAAKFPIVGVLKKGDVVRGYEEKNGWIRIGVDQWVLKSLLISQLVE